LLGAGYSENGLPQGKTTMIITLTEEQRHTLESAGDAVRVLDSQSKREYVLVPAEVYERLKHLLTDEDLDPEVMYPLLADIQPEDWEEASGYGMKQSDFRASTSVAIV
jgi:hypothetical protein